jgi:hypothetical protein
MSAVRGMIGLIAVISLFVGRAMGAAHPVAVAPAPLRVQEPVVRPDVDLTDLIGLPSTDDRGAWSSGQPRHDVHDVYDNDIQEAVGDYRVDAGGGIYESHAPNIEVAHLGPKIS